MEFSQPPPNDGRPTIENPAQVTPTRRDMVSEHEWTADKISDKLSGVVEARSHHRAENKGHERSLGSLNTSGSNSAVECDLAKVEVAGSNPVSRSMIFSSRFVTVS